MALEALNDGGKRKTNITVILNENEMSISENVGAISSYLNKLRTTKSYYKFKEGLESLLSKIPIIGKKLIRLIRKIKEGLKTTILNGGMFFEELGYRYIGPVDGHNVKSIVNVLEKIKKSEAPILLHICTTKGKGYKLAEENPDIYHGVGIFDIKNGKKIIKGKKTFSSVFGDKLVEIAKENNKIVALTAAMKDGTGLKRFSEEFPERFFDVGIAEQHGVTLAAGMASNGLIPVFAVYSTFLQRGYDQIIHDVAMQNLHVILCLDRAGIVGKDGETHQGVFDTSFLTNIPNMSVFTPGNFEELEVIMEYAVDKINSPVAIRYPRGGINNIFNIKIQDFNPFENQVLKKGKDLTILTHGRLSQDALNAANKLQEEGVSCELLYMRCINPIDYNSIINSANKTKGILIIDESLEDTSIKNRIISNIQEKSKNIRIDYLTLPNKFIEHGTVEDILERYHLSEEGIYKKIKEII